MVKEAHYQYRFGTFSIDTQERLLLREGKHVPLKQKAVETLTLLLRESPRVVEKDRFMREVWPDAFVEEGSLTVNISELRKALGGNSADKRYIETVPRRGYRFVAEVERVCLSDERPGAERDARPRITFREETVAATEPIKTLAVLPFVNVNSDPALDYLSDGITESIINSLSQLSPLRVLARSTVFRFKGREVDPQQIGRELGVRALLIGRVIQLGDKLVVSTELVDTTDGAQLWGTQYNRTTSDILALQEDIASEISRNLRLKLTSAEQKQLSKRYTEDVQAYHLYLRGRYYWNKRTPETLERALEFFREAVDKDPTYALAYAGIADCYNYMGYIFGRTPPVEAMSKARAAALKALEIDDRLAEAYASLAWIKYIFEWDRDSALNNLLKAIELNSNYAPVRHVYGSYLATVWGRFDEAVAEGQKGLELDPLSLPINHIVGFVLLLARRPDEAIIQFRRTLEIDPHYTIAHYNLGYAYEYKRMYKEAIEEYLRGSELGRASEEERMLARRMPRPSGWKDYLKKHLDLSLAEWEAEGPWHGYAYYIARNFARLGDKENAFVWLERAYEMRSGMLIWLNIEVSFDGLRSDPRFVDLVRRVGLAS
ncbi:MAG: winged helix-turn-helix domain-containing tetratricopeptide repeat protein [Pyrinomonadaceae bacterium]